MEKRGKKSRALGREFTLQKLRLENLVDKRTMSRTKNSEKNSATEGEDEKVTRKHDKGTGEKKGGGRGRRRKQGEAEERGEQGNSSQATPCRNTRLRIGPFCNRT